MASYISNILQTTYVIHTSADVCNNMGGGCELNFSVLQRVAKCCSVLHLRCNVLQHVTYVGQMRAVSAMNLPEIEVVLESRSGDFWILAGTKQLITHWYKWFHSDFTLTSLFSNNLVVQSHCLFCFFSSGPESKLDSQEIYVWGGYD